MNKKIFFNLFRVIAVLGNTIFILWIIYNGIDEGFFGALVQMVSYLALTFLLMLNIVLLLLKNK